MGHVVLNVTHRSSRVRRVMSEHARGSSSGRPTALQCLFVLLLCANLACILPKSAIWELIAAEKGAFRLLFLENKPAEEQQFDSSVEIWAAGASGDSEDAQNIKRCCLFYRHRFA